MNKTIGLTLAVIGLGTVGCFGGKTTSELETSCHVDIANVEVMRQDIDGIRPMWTSEFKNADGHVVGGVNAEYTWFICNDGKKLKLDNLLYRKPSFE